MYAVRQWNPWREFRQLRDEVDRYFQAESRRPANVTPAVNVFAQDDSLVVTTELPGIDQEQLEVSVANGVLRIAGTFEPTILLEGEKHQRRERSESKFERTLQLPFSVDVERTEATYRNGVLEIRLHRSEHEKLKQIAVKAG